MKAPSAPVVAVVRDERLEPEIGQCGVERGYGALAGNMHMSIPRVFRVHSP